MEHDASSQGDRPMQLIGFWPQRLELVVGHGCGAEVRADNVGVYLEGEKAIDLLRELVDPLLKYEPAGNC